MKVGKCLKDWFKMGRYFSASESVLLRLGKLSIFPCKLHGVMNSDLYLFVPERSSAWTAPIIGK